MPIPAYRNTNVFYINIPSPEGHGIDVPANKCVVGDYFTNFAYPVIDGLVLADLDYTNIDPQTDIVYTAPISSAPASATAPGYKGELRGDANYLYYAYDTDKWIRIAKSTWP